MTRGSDTDDEEDSQTCPVCAMNVRGGPGSMATHRRLNTTCSYMTSKADDARRLARKCSYKDTTQPQNNVHTPIPPCFEADVANEDQDDAAEYHDEPVDGTIGADCELGIGGFEPAPIPLLPELDMQMGAKERAYARFRIVAEMSRSANPRTVVTTDGAILNDSDTGPDNDLNADATDRVAIASSSPENPTNSAGIQGTGHEEPSSVPGDQTHVVSDGLSDDRNSQLNTLFDLRSSLVSLFCPDDGSAGLTLAQRKKTMELVRLSLCAGGNACSVYDVVHTTSSRSKNLEVLFQDHISSLIDADGWVSKAFEVVGGKAIARWNASAMSSLSAIVEAHHAVLLRQPTWNGKEYGHPTSGRYMKVFFDLIQSQRRFFRDWNRDEDFPLLLTYFSDATLLANRGSLSAHPVVVGVANLPTNLYQSNLVTVGYLDTSIEYSPGLDPDGKREVKRALIGMQVSAMMEQFMIASYEGCYVQLPVAGEDDGPRRARYFPGLFDAALDYPEMVSLLGIKSGCCGICHWKTEFGGVDFKGGDFRHGVGVPRTEKRSREAFEAIGSESKKSKRKELVNRFGVHPQRPSALWGFNGSCPIDRLPDSIPASLRIKLEHWALLDRSKYHNASVDRRSLDVHIIVSTETMHEVDLGLTCYLRSAIFEILRDDGLTLEMIEETVNQPLLRAMTIESRWQGLFHPPLTRETSDVIGYFGGCAKVQASEHRSVLQVLVPVLCRALGFKHDATRLAAVYLKYYTSRERRLTPGKYHTEETLAETERLFSVFHKRLLDLRPGGRTEYNQSKAHVQLHFSERVRRAGHSFVTTGEAGESQNAKIKAPYKGNLTNKQTRHVANQLVRIRRQTEAAGKLKKMAARTAVLPSPVSNGQPGGTVKYDTSFVIAARNDSVAFTKHSNVRGRDIFDTDQLQNYVDTVDSRLETHRSFSLEQLNGQHRYFTKTFGSPDIARRFLSEIAWWATHERDYSEIFDPETFVLRMKAVRNAVSASVWPGEERRHSQHRILQRLRCNPSFRTQDVDEKTILWNDFVAIRGQYEHLGEHTWYARLILMFHLQCPSSGEWLQYAFVRYMIRVEHKNNEMARVARSDDEPQVTQLKYATRRMNNKEVWYYGLLLVECIERKIQVIAGNEEASLSLRKSRGEPKYWLQDKTAKFLVNNYVWQSQTEHQYTLINEAI